MITHKVRAHSGPVCATMKPGEQFSGWWIKVNCPKCLATRKTESQRVAEYKRKKKISRGTDV